jgi:hypothetical protein
MNQRTDLSGGAINGPDRIVVELIEPPDAPPIVAITWPGKPTVCTTASYPAVAAAITRIIAESATALARWKAHGRKRLVSTREPWTDHLCPGLSIVMTGAVPLNL